MDDNNLPDDGRQSLYEEFISEIVKAGNPEAFFDEDDLVEIFDYSSDMDNYIAKMEVLLYGARFYPDSQALATRRAWFYSSFGEIDAAAELNSRVSNGGVLNELLKLRASGMEDTPQLRQALDQIVASTTDFADEDLIQLADFCAEAELFDWLEANYELIKSKCTYPQTFIYEYANRCEDSGDLAKAVSLFEELTMMEPFTLDFWERLAKAQLSTGDLEAAIASADYALAISTTSFEAMRVKAAALFSLRRGYETVLALLDQLFEKNLAGDAELSIYALILMREERAVDALPRIKEYLEQRPLSKVGLRLLVSIDTPASEPYVKRLQDELAEARYKGQEAPSFISAWAAEEYMNGALDVAAKLVLLADKYSSLDEKDYALGAEILFHNNSYEDVVELCDKGWLEKGFNLFYYPHFIYPFVISTLKLNQRDDANRIVDFALERVLEYIHENEKFPVRVIPGLTHVEQFIYIKGYYDFLQTIKADLSDPEKKINPQDYYPKF